MFVTPQRQHTMNWTTKRTEPGCLAGFVCKPKRKMLWSTTPAAGDLYSTDKRSETLPQAEHANVMKNQSGNVCSTWTIQGLTSSTIKQSVRSRPQRVRKPQPVRPHRAVADAPRGHP